MAPFTVIFMARFTFTSGNFPQITRVLLGKISSDDGKMSYVYDQYVFHYMVEDGLTFLCMADDAVEGKRRIPYAFLEDIKSRFMATYGESAQTAIAFEMNQHFGRTLQKQMEFFNGPQADQLSEVTKKIEDVKNVMVQNIEMVLERGEKLELLVDKTEQFQNSAFTFQKQTRKLKEAMFWKKVKCYAMIVGAALLVTLILSMIICSPNYSQCKSDDDSR